MSTPLPHPAWLPTPAPGPLAFDVPVPPDGYRWWYLDALADGGDCGLTVIAFVGSVFSPYYAWARRRGPANPEDHCALNVALYGPRSHRWTMTERRAAHVVRRAGEFVVGPSHVAWDGTCLTIAVDEWTVPLPSRIRGRIRVWPGTTPRTRAYALDGHGRHRWTPIAPHAHVEVELQQPSLRWSGVGYLDSNGGDEPLERGFRQWTWSRADLGTDAAVLYDVERRDGEHAALALRVGADEEPTPFDPPPVAELARARVWRMPRCTRADAGAASRVLATYEDAPFYARSLVESRLLGSRVLSVHESLDLDRFSSPVVQAMLPFRMPRAFPASRPGAASADGVPSSCGAGVPSSSRDDASPARSRRSDQSS